MRSLGRSAVGRDAAAFIFYGVLFVGLFCRMVFGHRFVTTGGDGVTLALPAYLRAPTLWEPNIMLGYPWSANLDGFWDPLAVVLRTLPHTFNVYMLAAYVIAAFGTYRLVLTLTGSRLGALISGISFALGGFLISHLGHYDILHPAAWTPWVVWAFAALRARVDARTIAAGALAIALNFVSGQPQVSAYTLVLSLAFAIVAGVRQPYARRYWIACALTFCGGIGLAAIALVPGAQLAQASVRAKMTFDTFITYSNPPNEAPIRLLFPYFLGQTHSSVYPFSVLGFGSWVELSNYAGITPLVLAAVAAFASFRDRLVRFWIAVAVIALALGAGDGFKLAQLTYHLPVLGLFRAQGRHALESTLAVAVLAGYGTAAIAQRKAGRTTVFASVGFIGSVIAGVLAAIALLDRPFASEVVARTGWPAFPIDPLHNPALTVPLLVYVSGAAVVLTWSRRPSSAGMSVALVAVVTIDMASFAWFAPWQDSSIGATDLAALPAVGALRSTLDRTHERVLVIPRSGSWAGLDPDLNELWNFPLTGGRVQLEVASTAAPLHIDADGLTSPDMFEDARDLGLELSAIRFIVLPPGSQGIRPVAAPWDAADLNVRIGSPAWTTTSWVPRSDFSTHFAQPVPVSRVLLVSSMSDASTIGNGTRIGEIVLTDEAGEETALPLVAGKDTAERGYDRPNVLPFVRHLRAPIFDSLGIDHRYVASLPLVRAQRVSAVAVRWTSPDPAHGYLNIEKLTLADDKAGKAYPLAPMTALQIASDRWRPVGALAPTVLFENQHALGRTWLVHRVAPADAADALVQIRSGRLDPVESAVAENAPTLQTAAGPDEDVRIAALDAQQMTLDVRCASDCFAVTSDAWDPGWQAAIDGRSTRVYRADYALRGVFVPAGTHRIVFSFRPRDLAFGVGITLASALCLGVLAFRPSRSAAARQIGE